MRSLFENNIHEAKTTEDVSYMKERGFKEMSKSLDVFATVRSESQHRAVTKAKGKGGNLKIEV